MILQYLELYNLLSENKDKFQDFNLSADFYIDIYRSQPLQPELYEYFSLPAIFVDYKMTGNGKNQRRTISITLHIIVDDLPDSDNMSESKSEGLSRFTYLLILQSLIEGSKLGKTTQLKFMSEDIIDTNVVNYHTQTYEFEAHIADLIPEFPDIIYGQFEHLNIYGSLLKNL